MPINERLQDLGDNPFTRLNALLAAPPQSNEPPLILSVGEPQHAAPPWLAETILAHADLWNKYPPIAGTDAFRGAVADWLSARYHLPAGMITASRHVLALCGTKEGLYLAAQMAVSAGHGGSRPAILLPNPYYLVYRGGAVMAGAELVALPATRATGFLPDFAAIPVELLQRTAFVFLCSPANPQGAIASLDYLRNALRLARQHGFVLAVDECYSEIYDGEPPPGALEAAVAEGGSLDNLLVFHSLSKRSNAAGLRAGFVAGDETLIRALFTLRSYGGSQMPLPVQAGAAALWRDESHVIANRALYRRKIDIAEQILGDRFGFYRPAGGFFLWLETGESEAVTKVLWRDAAIKVVPGAYLAETGADGINPGADFIRVALVHDEPTVAEALRRLVAVL